MQLGLRHDHARRWRYSPLQSPFASRELGRYSILATALDSIHVVAGYGTPNEQVLSSSDAGLLFWRTLSGWPRTIGWLLALAPRFLREPAYRCIASQRYRWFGRYEACKLPTAEQSELFIWD